MNPNRWLTLPITALLNLMPGTIAVHAADTVPIAGLSPSQRPAGAPQITKAAPPDPARALHGISTPIPASLKFLDDQGNWYTPFTEPGMPPPYDLRGWHSKPPVSGQSKK